MTPKAVGFLLIGLLFSSSRPAVASAWPASIFDGADPRVVAEVQAHPDLVKEAEFYLSTCDRMDGDTKSGCISTQYEFVLDYIYSMYNEVSSQQNVAYNLSGDGEPPRDLLSGAAELGINPDPAWGCAWRIVAIEGGNAGFMNTSLDDYNNDCLRLSRFDQNSANAFAASILLEIKAHLDKGNPPLDIYFGVPAGQPVALSK